MACLCLDATCHILLVLSSLQHSKHIRIRRSQVVSARSLQKTGTAQQGDLTGHCLHW
uniref:Uncharacterized protein n=1 Tax=Ulva partita TaxID=1605170 RepID=A0A1C9ZWE0_9CHLO|nr:hypothetical protein [Ulva partita]